MEQQTGSKLGKECIKAVYCYLAYLAYMQSMSCCKEQYYIGTWNVKSMSQGIWEMIKQEMARLNVNILGISKLKWTGMGEFNSEDHYIYYCGQESLRRNGVAIILKKKESKMQYLDAVSKNDRMISVHFQGKPFNIMIIQVYAPTSNAEEAEQFSEDLKDCLELTLKKRCPFHYRRLECKSRKSRDAWNDRQVWPWRTE